MIERHTVDIGLLEHAKFAVQKRNVLLADILHLDKLCWMACLTHGYLRDSGHAERELRSLADTGVLADASPSASLLDLLASGRLTEGVKYLPPEVLGTLLGCAGEQLAVRNGMDVKMFEPCMLADLLRNADDGFDFEAAGASGLWYLRTKPDDVLIFLAADSSLSRSLVDAAPESMLVVDAEFVFSP